MKNLNLFIIGIGLILTFSCNPDDEEMIPQENRLVTTLEFTVMNIAGDTIKMRHQDLDGPGGDAPIVEGGTLKANSLYFAMIEVSNEAETPVEDITAEIESNTSDFQFFFIKDGVNLDFMYADTDANGLPLGLLTAINTGDAGSGNLVINLQKGLNKLAAGVSEGQIDNAGGRTDIQVTFPIEIE